MKLDEFVHSLAIHQGRLHRYYDGDIKGRTAFSLEPLGPLVIQWITEGTERELENEEYNTAMLVTAEQFMEHIGPQRELSESRRLYTAALLFSAMLFMTAGYGDMLPNSDIIAALMAVQFAIHVAVFILMIPMVLQDSRAA